MAELQLKVIPNASKTEIIGWQSNLLKVKLKAVPEKGKANKELIEFLAKILSISKRDIQIITGEKQSTKCLSIEMPTDDWKAFLKELS